MKGDTGINTCDLGLSNNISAMTPKWQTINKKKINWISSKFLKFRFKGHSQKSEKTTHRMAKIFSYI